MWRVATTDEFDEWFIDLNEGGQAEIIAKVELLKALGPRLSRPHADTLKGSKHANMKELRADTADMVCESLLRLILNAPQYCWLPGTSRGSARSGFTSN